jgi:hypothetical protein
MASHPAVTVGTLPPELLRQIFDAVDHGAPSEYRLNEQPEGDMLRNPDTPLKNISLVSEQWRAIVLPMLFRNVVWALESCDQLVAQPREDSSSHSDPADEIPILAFLRANDLARHVRSLTIIVCRMVDLVDPPEPRPGATGARNVSRFGLWRQARFRSPLVDAQAHYGAPANSATVYNGDNNWLWRMLFSIMDPLRLSIIASPQTLARLLSCMVFVGDADFFSTEERLHILSLSRDSSSPAAPQPSGPKASSQAAPPASHKCCAEREYTPTALFTIRPWTHLLLNENSSIRVYKSYHYFDRRPPSILSSLLGWEEAPHNVMMVPPTITTFSYIAIFPLATQLSMMVYRLPRIENLYLQLVPRNDILLDKIEMDHVTASDLWLERNSCYELVMRNMLNPVTAPFLNNNNTNNNNNNNDDDDDDDDGGDDDEDIEWDDDHDDDEDWHDGHDIRDERPGRTYNWQHLRRFETGDLADRDAWLDAVDWVEESRSGWRVERGGVFVKGPAPTKSAKDGPLLV